MKFVYRLIIFLLIFSSSYLTYAGLFDNGNPTIPYCNGTPCWLKDWVNEVRAWVIDMETNRWFSDYIQDIAIYVLSFISIIAVIYLMYAGFIVLTSAWDEEKLKKTKSIIIYVIIWIIIIWLAWPILSWLLGVLNN